MRRLIYILLIGVLVGLFAFPTSAQTLKRQYLDETTLSERGFTISQKDFYLGIPPGRFHEGAWVVLKSSDLTPPRGWKFLDGPVIYDIQVKKQQFLESPLWLGFDRNGYSTDKKVAVAFFNGVTGEWQFIPSNRIPSGTFRAALHFPYAAIALLEHKTELAAPQQIAPDPYLPDVISAAVSHRSSGSILYGKSQRQVRSIASITKLMTALVVLDQKPDWDRLITYSSTYDREGASLHISPGERLTFRDLWYTMLVGSANNAAVALASNSGMSLDQFITAMNKKAQQLNLRDTKFVEPTGLDSRNTSTAEEILVFSGEAFRHMDILKGTTTKQYSFATSAGNWHSIKTTNDLLYSPLYVTGSKTGFTDEAGFSLVMQTVGPLNQEILAVVLGTSSKASREASEEALINWTYQAFAWR